MRVQKYLALFMIVGVLCAALPSLPSSANPISPTVFIQVPASAYDKTIPALRVLDYGSFVWAEVPADSLAALDARGIPYQVGGMTIGMYGFKFDPLQGEPNIPAGLRREPAANEPNLYLVQFVGPTQDRWLTDLQTMGLKPLQYYGNYAYLVWGTGQQVSLMAAHPAYRWSGLLQPAYKINPGLDGMQGRIANVAVTFYNDGAVNRTLQALTDLGAGYIQHFPAQPDQAFFTAIVTLDAARLADVARLSTVWGLDYLSPRPGFDDEVSAQIAAGNVPSGTPVVGYYNWLTARGVSGSGIRWADVDTGLNTSHPDVQSRAVAFVGYTGCGDPHQDSDGHGSHTAGTIFADPRASSGGTGITDPNGFYWGTGMAPAANLVVQNGLAGACSNWPPTGGWQQFSKDSVLNGAIGSSNSWNTGLGHQGYSSAARTHDLMVRDANFDTTNVAEPLIMVFSAGNSGPGGNSMTDPHEAKNLITAGATENYPRIGSSINDIASFSSRGPGDDGRLLPTITTPGEQQSSLNGNGTTCGTPVSGPGASYYNYCAGTSMACPVAAGSATLIADWWNQDFSGVPSPAMVKALLINGGEDMFSGVGVPTHKPDNTQGWGRVDLSNVIRTGVPSVYTDQTHLFANTGETWVATWSVADPTKPVRISMAWTDMAGAIGANPALVNDLDLAVVVGGNTYKGNVFSSGWSVPGGSADTLNNLENVFVQAGVNGTIQITVQATNIAGDGVPYNGDPTDQDFALVCYNCYEGQNFTLAATPDAFDLCAPQVVSSTIDVGSILGYSHDVTLEVGNVPAGVNADITPAVVTPPGQAVLTLDVTNAAATGDYTLIVTGTGEVTNVHTVAVDLAIANGLPNAPTLISPPDGAMDQPFQPTLEWAGSAVDGPYNLQVDYTPAFAAPLIDVSVPITEYVVPAPLAGGRCYWWRTQAENQCGTGPYAEPFHFGTAALGAVFSDDVESGNIGWTAGGTPNTWAITTEDSHSPTHSWTDSPGANYINYADNYIASPVIDLSAASQVSLSFWHKYVTESGYDYCHVEYSTNGGGTWTELISYNGTLSTWTQVTLDVPQLAYQANARIRFHFTSDVSVVYDGWHIDDIQVIAPLPQNPAPTLLNIVPNSGPGYTENPVQIHGTGFVDVPSLQLGTTWLLSVTLVNSTTINAVVPAGLPEGVYDLTLYNGDCQEAVLPDAYTVINQCVAPSVELATSSPVELGQPLYFTATLITGTLPLFYTWDMGGPGYGAGLDTATPVYTYTAAGDFVATATVTNSCGADAVTTTVTVECAAPAASFVSNSPVVLGQPMQFTSTVSGTGPLTYAWNFGDGVGAGTDPNPVYTYTAAGDYTVTLTVEGPCGTAVVSQVVTVLPPCVAPEASFTSDSPVVLSLPMQFTSTVSGTGPFTYTWDFGDGAGTSSAANPAYTYTAAGDYTVTLTVVGACGTDVASATVTVECVAPAASFTSDSPVDLGLPMHFTSTVSGSGPFTYTWTFGDGMGTSTAANPVYTYTAAGSYTVTLSVAGLCGTDSFHAVVLVQPAAPQYNIYLPLVFRGYTP
jgi:PKD repeat protein